MPVAVNVPIRIKVDPEALWMRQRCIEDALSKAVRRALAKSSKEVLDARGGYVTVRLHAPEIHWTGDGLEHVTPAQRVATRELVSSVLEKAAAAAGILSRAEGQRTVPMPLPDDASERIDPDRHAPLLGRYLIPSYDGTQRKTVVKAQSKGKPTIQKADPSPYVLRFKTLQPTWDKIDFLFELYEKALGYDPEKPYLPMNGPGVVGLMFRHYAGGYAVILYRVPNPRRVLVEDIDKPTFTLLNAGFRITQIGNYVPRGRSGLQLQPTALSPATDVFRIVWLPATTTAARREIEERVLRTSLPAYLEAERQKFAPNLNDAEFSAWLTATVDDQIAALIDDAETKSYVLLDEGTSLQRPIALDIERPSGVGNDPILVFPASEEVLRPKVKKQVDGAKKGKRSKESTEKSRIDQEGPESREGPEGSAAKPSPPGDPNATVRDCSDDYSTSFSALNPESYLDDDDHLKCRPLLGEPALKNLGPHAKDLESRVARITAELGLSTCGAYAGSFCLGAAQEIARQARRIGEQAAYEGATGGILKSSSDGNLGFVQFDPMSTAAVQELHRLAGLLDDVMELGDRMQGLYRWWWPHLCGRWYERESQWGLAFDVLFHPIKTDAVGNLFKAACRVVLLQLLEASRSQIDARKRNLATYAPMFQFVFRAYFTEKADLEKLKARLQLASLTVLGLPPGALDLVSGSWQQVTTSLLEEINKGNVTPSGNLTVKDDLVFNGETLVGIQDEHGTLWTKASLERALTQREFLVESIDPMIKQFSDDEAAFILGLLKEKPTIAIKFKSSGLGPKLGDIETAVLEKIDDAGKISAEVVVGAVLEEMLTKNGDQARKTRKEFDYAFDMAPIHKDAKRSRIRNCSFALQGIHKLADEQIGPAFRMHPERYGWELNDVIAARAGLESLTFFAKAVGVAILSVVCPPLGVAAGTALAIQDYEKALEKKALFRSLIDPDLVITRAEVEAELFAAELGLVLSFLPNAKPILSGAAKGIQVFTTQGVRGTARAVVSQTRRALTGESAKAAAAAVRERFARGFAEAIKDDFAVALTRELVQDQFMDLFLGKLLLEPIVKSIQDDFKGYSSAARGPGMVTHTFRQGAP